MDISTHTLGHEHTHSLSMVADRMRMGRKRGWMNGEKIAVCQMQVSTASHPCAFSSNILQSRLLDKVLPHIVVMATFASKDSSFIELYREFLLITR